MVKRKHSIEQIIGKLRETEVELAQGRSVAEVCRSLGVPEFWSWLCLRPITAGERSTAV